MSQRKHLPGSQGEKELQEKLGTVDRANRFYSAAVKDSLTDRMVRFLMDRKTAFVGCTRENDHETTVRLRHGPGLVMPRGREAIAWREPIDSELVDWVTQANHGSLLTVDWENTTVGLHVNGSLSLDPRTEEDGYVNIVLDIEEAYIHCAKHLPKLRCLAGDASPVGRPGLQETEDDGLTDPVRDLISERIFFLLGTADEEAETDISPRFGPQGFVQITDDGEALAYPEYRGNGIHASLGNMLESSRASMTFVDWWRSSALVSISGSVTLCEEDEPPNGAEDLTGLDKTKMWVRLEPESVVVRRPSLPRYTLDEYDPAWGTDDPKLKKSGFFSES